jgi:putative transposase
LKFVAAQAAPWRKTMRLVEQHIIKQGDPRYEKIEQTAFASKNLWNAANYVVRQSFIHEGIYLDNVKVFHQVKSHEAYQALPRKVGNQVLIQLHQAWVAFLKRWMSGASTQRSS